MADNTVLNAGAGGDTIRTEDVGGGVKIPANKWHTGGQGVDGGPVTITNPGPILIASGGLSAGVFAFHNLDNQSLGTTATGLNVGGVAQLLNVTGNLDRQRETGVDTISSLGVAAGSSQLSSPFTLLGTSPATGSQLTTVNVTSLSGTNRGAPWAVQVGSTLQVGSYGDPLFEVIYVTAVNTAGQQTFTAGFKNTHVAPFAISGSVYNQARDATVVDGASGQGFAAGATYLLNTALNGGAGGWEGERSAAGELDDASGKGTAVAAEYMWSGVGFDRTRNVQGKGQGSGSLQVALVSGGLSVVPAVLPVGLAAGAPLLLWGGNDTAETVYTTSSYVGGASPITLAQGCQFAHTSATILIWDRFSNFGPGLGPVAPFGVGIEEEIVWSPTLSASFVERAADADAMQPYNLVAEAECVWNGSSFDRAREVIGDAQAATGLPAEVPMLFNGATYDRLKGTTNAAWTMPQSGSVTGLLVGGVAVSLANPVPVTGSFTLASVGTITGSVTLAAAPNVTTLSGSLTGLLVGGVAASDANPVPVALAWDACGQVLSGTTTRTVQYSFGDFGTSGSVNQVVAPQGANNKIRVLSVHLMPIQPVNVRWQSTGSAGSINNISGLFPLGAQGGFVLNHNPHGWFQTNANEGLNLNLSAAVSCGLVLTWVIAGP